MVRFEDWETVVYSGSQESKTLQALQDLTKDFYPEDWELLLKFLYTNLIDYLTVNKSASPGAK